MQLISATMALEALKDQVSITTQAKEQHALELARRDNLIRAARDAGIPEAKLVAITGLSRDSISRIRHSAPKDTDD